MLVGNFNKTLLTNHCSPIANLPYKNFSRIIPAVCQALRHAVSLVLKSCLSAVLVKCGHFSHSNLELIFCSVISLATKCAMPSFRMHLRAHGMVAMVFKTLDDSQHHQVWIHGVFH